MQIKHHAIPGDLGDNGGGRYGSAELVTFPYGFLGERDLDGLISVDEDEIWKDGKVLYRQSHGFQCGLKDIEKIDLLVANDANPHSHGFDLDNLIKIFAFLRWYLF